LESHFIGKKLGKQMSWQEVLVGGWEVVYLPGSWKEIILLVEKLRGQQVDEYTPYLPKGFRGHSATSKLTCRLPAWKLESHLTRQKVRKIGSLTKVGKSPHV
jgi:hypothetical protein